jgi:hypothetical protein
LQSFGEEAEHEVERADAGGDPISGGGSGRVLRADGVLIIVVRGR